MSEIAERFGRRVHAMAVQLDDDVLTTPADKLLEGMLRVVEQGGTTVAPQDLLCAAEKLEGLAAAYRHLAKVRAQ